MKAVHFKNRNVNKYSSKVALEALVSPNQNRFQRIRYIRACCWVQIPKQSVMSMCDKSICGCNKAEMSEVTESSGSHSTMQL